VLKIYVCKFLVKPLKLTQNNTKICKAKRKEIRRIKYTINILARLKFIFCCGKYTLLIFWDCFSSLSYPGCSSKTPIRILFCGQRGSILFFVIISWNDTIYIRNFFNCVFFIFIYKIKTLSLCKLPILRERFNSNTNFINII